MANCVNSYALHGDMRYMLLSLGLLLSSTLCYSEAPPDRAHIIREIDAIRTRFHIPGIAFGVANCDAVLLLGSVGISEIATTNRLAIDDRFHIGSLGKGLLAFMAGRLVDEGKICWNTKFFDLYPEMKPTAREEYYDVDLQDLLSHRAMLNRFNDWHAQELIDRYNALHKQDRLSWPTFASYALTLEPERCRPGESYKYSTLGYLLAALMLEKASGLNYALLLAKTGKDVDVGFQIGWPKRDGKFQPCGHLIPKEQGWGEGTALAVWNGDKFVDWGEDYLSYATPAGHLNATVPDFLKYLRLCLNGVNGRDNYLKASTYDFIFNGAKEYSMGWGNDIVKGKHHYSHTGSGGTFFANAIIIKEPKIAIAIMANAGNGETKGGLLQVIKLLEETYVK